MLRQGAPTYKRRWVSEYDLDDTKCCAKRWFRDSAWRPEAKSCGDVKSCLFCAAAARRAQDIDDGYKDEQAVAALLIRSRAKGWHNPDSSSIFDFIRSLNDALKGTPKFQKYLSHFGGLRLDKGNVMRAVSRAELNNYYPVMKIDLATNTMTTLRSMRRHSHRQARCSKLISPCRRSLMRCPNSASIVRRSRES